MNRRTFVKTLPAFTMLAGTASVFAQDLPPIALPKPEKDGGKSVLAALWERRTIRDISAERLSPQMLSNLLWAAFGVNRQNGPFGQVGRTAASASNSQEIDVYVALPEGVYNCSRMALAADLKLRPEQRVVFAQTVGHPSES